MYNLIYFIQLQGYLVGFLILRSLGIFYLINGIYEGVLLYPHHSPLVLFGFH